MIKCCALVGAHRNGRIINDIHLFTSIIAIRNDLMNIKIRKVTSKSFVSFMFLHMRFTFLSYQFFKTNFQKYGQYVGITVCRQLLNKE